MVVGWCSAAGGLMDFIHVFFIGYVDSEGVGHKPFLLPQKDPLTYYDALMFSYNIPELMRSAVTVDACR